MTDKNKMKMTIEQLEWFLYKNGYSVYTVIGGVVGGLISSILFTVFVTARL